MADDELADRLLREVMEENRLDEASERAGVSTADQGPGAPPPVPTMMDFEGGSDDGREARDSDYSDVSDGDELPWCCMCNGNATLRCADCEGDLYCRTCYRKTHADGELRSHRTSGFKPPRRRNR